MRAFSSQVILWWYRACTWSECDQSIFCPKLWSRKSSRRQYSCWQSGFGIEKWTLLFQSDGPFQVTFVPAPRSIDTIDPSRDAKRRVRIHKPLGALSSYTDMRPEQMQ